MSPDTDDTVAQGRLGRAAEAGGPARAIVGLGR